MAAEKTPVEAVEDFRGNVIRVGDTVLYPRMSGRSVEMSEATVLAMFRVDDRTVYDDHPEWAGVNGDAPRWIRRDVPAYAFSLAPGKGTRGFYRGGTSKVYISIGENVVAANG